MTAHYLKIWPEYYARVLSCAKTFEVRYNDRDYQAGDWLVLHRGHRQLRVRRICRPRSEGHEDRLMATCRWWAHEWSVWWPAKFGMLRRSCSRCGVLQHAHDRDTSRRIRGNA